MAFRSQAVEKRQLHLLMSMLSSWLTALSSLRGGTLVLGNGEKSICDFLHHPLLPEMDNNVGFPMNM